jgi:fimbrial isopeptide formation D2 family protein
MPCAHASIVLVWYMRKLPGLLTGIMILGCLMFLPVKADRSDGTTFAITKVATPSVVGVSSNVSFAITIENISSSNSAPVKVVDTLPTGWTFNNDAKLTDLEDETTDFTPTVDGQVLTWVFDGSTLQSIPQNDNIVINFSAKSPATTGTFINQGCLEEPEQVCANAQIDVQAGIPSTGIVENIAVIGLLSTSLILISLMIRKNKKSFEDKMLSKL